MLHREVVVKATAGDGRLGPGGQSLPPGAVVLEVLDPRQEQVARSLGEGHHVFFGVAGSGKTVLLLARAEAARRPDPAKRVLVLCYNRALAAYLATCLGGDPAYRGVEVRHVPLLGRAAATGLPAARRRAVR